MIVPRFCTQPLVSYSFSPYLSLSFFALFCLFFFLILFASLHAFLPVSPTLHLCFFICLFLPFPQSQSLSTLSLSCSPSLILTSLFVSLSQSSTSFTFTLGPTVFFSLSLSLIFFHFSVFASLPQPFLSEPQLTEALLYLPVCLTQLSSKKPPMSSIFLQSQAVTSVAADSGELDLRKIILVLKKLEETLGPATSLQKGGSDISVSFRPQLEPLYGSEPDRFRNESLTLKKPCLCVQLHHGHPLYRSGHHSSLLKLTSVLTSPLFQKTIMPVLEGTERSSVLLESAVKHDYLSGEWEEKSKDKTGEVTWGQAR